MRWRLCPVICDVTIVIGVVSFCALSVPATAQQRLSEDSPMLHGADETGIDIVRMPPSLPVPTATAPLPPPDRSAREAAQPQGSFLEFLVTVGSMPTDSQKGWVGIKLDALDLPLATALGLEDANGVLVLDTTAGGPANQAGLRIGDVVVDFAGKAVQSVNDLSQDIHSASPGTAAVLKVWRFANANDGDFVQTLRRSAERGDPHVMCRLGRMYATGAGVTRDNAEAVQWYRRAAAAGSSDAQAALATMVLEGHGTTGDIQEGLSLLRAAADKNNVAAMYRMGRLLVEGKVLNKDELEASRLFIKAADLGHVPSMVDIGVMYFTGAGVPANPQKATAWFKRAADLGHAGAMVNLGLAYTQGKGVETDFDKAAMWFKRAADLGHAGGMVDLGLLYAQGKGVERNDAAAVGLYRKAASSGEVTGMVNLAWMLTSGRGVERKDPEQAADLIMKSLDQRSESAHGQMTQNYRAWSKEFRQALQKKLRGAGFNPGPVDGNFRESTIASISAYFNRNR